MIQLTSIDLIENRPFTHLHHNARDLVHLERARQHLVRALEALTPDAIDCQHHLELSDEGGHGARLIILRPRAILEAPMLTVVGFCGQKRVPLQDAEQNEMAQVDAALVTELCDHSDMLSYCSVEDEHKNWCNLVLMTRQEAIQHWRASERHQQAVDSLTPRFYRHIRLHNGILAQGLTSEKIVLTSTKYYDFEDTTVWRAIRNF
jgi:hypothetical protein